MKPYEPYGRPIEPDGAMLAWQLEHAREERRQARLRAIVSSVIFIACFAAAMWLIAGIQ